MIYISKLIEGPSSLKSVYLTLAGVNQIRAAPKKKVLCMETTLEEVEVTMMRKNKQSIFLYVCETDTMHCGLS